MRNYIIILFFVVSITSVYAHVWHINIANDVLKDFTQLQEANDSPNVVPSDTLYIYPGTYNPVTLNKRLVIIGTGYFLDKNTENQFNTNSSQIQNGQYGSYGINFTLGSEGSCVTGLSVYDMYIEADNITVKRNYFMEWQNQYVHSNFRINGAKNVLILQNYINGSYYLGYNYNSIPAISIEGSYPNGISGIQLKGNIIKASHNWSSTKVAITSNVACLIANNTFRGNIDVIDANLINNILIEGTYNGHDTSFLQNNICDANQFAPNGENGNICDYYNTQYPFLFSPSDSPDGSWRLIPGTPATNAGLNGVECGAFGGTLPYVLSGMPSEIPTIYYFSSQSAGYTYPIHIKAKTH